MWTYIIRVEYNLHYVGDAQEWLEHYGCLNTGPRKTLDKLVRGLFLMSAFRLGPLPQPSVHGVKWPGVRPNFHAPARNSTLIRKS